MVTLLPCLTCLLLASSVEAQSVSAYYLNKNIDLASVKCKACPDVECVYKHDDEGKLRMPDQLSICYRWMPYQYTDKPEYISILSYGQMKNDMSALLEGVVYGVWLSGPWLGIKRPNNVRTSWISAAKGSYDLFVWVHTCISIDFETGQFKHVEDGMKKMDTIYENIPVWAKDFSGKANFASVGCAYRDGGGHLNMSVQGQVSDFQVWYEVLNDELMIDYTNCAEPRVQGSIIDWDKEPWIFRTVNSHSNVELVDLKNKICPRNSHSFIFLPTAMPFEGKGILTCDKFSGRVAGYSSKQEYMEVINFLSQKNHYQAQHCLSETTNATTKLTTWLAGTDNKIEGTWKDFYSDKLIEYLPWLKERPYTNGYVYNCMVNYVLLNTAENKYEVSDSIIADWKCESEFCNVCKIEQKNRKVKIRGLCEKSAFNRDYAYTVHNDGTPLFVGKLSSSIYYNEKLQKWFLIDRYLNNTAAEIIAPKESYLLGQQILYFNENRDTCTLDLDKGILKVKITTCASTEFTCNDGQCVSMDLRCDQAPNCADGSDEKLCKMLVMNENYNKKISPLVVDPLTFKIFPTNVMVSILIQDILKLIEVDHEYVLKFKFIMEWYDHRLTYFNLKVRRSANALGIDEIHKIWIPNLVFTNTQNNENTKGNDDSEVTVTREGNYTVSRDDIVEEINIFDGKDNRLTFEMTYTKTLRCEYQLQMYPFDKQLCTMDISVKNLDQVGVKITPDNIVMLGDTVLTQYIVQSWQLSYQNNSNPNDGIVMSIKLQRRLVNELLTTYLPSFIILVIVYCTNYFKPFFFEAVVTVNLTSLLVLTTLFISVSDYLPKTAYIKECCFDF